MGCIPWRNPDYIEEWSYNPEPFDAVEPDNMVGIPQDCMGAIVTKQDDGRWRCEHGRGPHVTDIQAALDCLSHCEIEEETTC